MTKEEFKKEIFELWIKYGSIESTPKGITMILTNFTDKLWETYEIKRIERGD